MKKTMVMFLTIISSLCGFSQKMGEITVTVSDIKKQGEGEVIFMLFYKSDGFPDDRSKAYKVGKVEDFGNKATYTFKDVPYGEYAVSVHQDKDQDGGMKRNFIGMPREPVGASNLTKMGKPNFDKCTFIVNAPSEEIHITFIIAN